MAIANCSELTGVEFGEIPSAFCNSSHSFLLKFNPAFLFRARSSDVE
jgi:hypothetical protein